MRCERLHGGHEVASFRCDHADLDLFLTRYAARNQDRLFVGTTYVAVDGETVAGYVTVALAQLDRAELPAVAEDPGGAKGPATQAVRLPRYPLPGFVSHGWRSTRSGKVADSAAVWSRTRWP